MKTFNEKRVGQTKTVRFLTEVVRSLAVQLNDLDERVQFLEEKYERIKEQGKGEAG